MHYRTSLLILLLSFTLNILGSVLTTYFKLPLFLDAIGTMLSAVLIGPWIGGLLGLMTNLLKGIFYTSHSIPFGLVNFGIGVLTGYLTILLKDYRRPVAPLLIGCCVAIVTPMMAAPIATYMFGGITAHGIDKFVVTLLQSGESILSSAFWGRIPFSFFDKLLSAYLVYLIVLYWQQAAHQRFAPVVCEESDA